MNQKRDTTVLLVEDDIPQRKTLKGFLEQFPKITTECIALAVGKVVITKGSKQHVSVYLEAIKNLYLKWEKKQ